MLKHDAPGNEHTHTVSFTMLLSPLKQKVIFHGKKRFGAFVDGYLTHALFLNELDNVQSEGIP